MDGLEVKPTFEKSIIACQLSVVNKSKFMDKAKTYGGTSFVLRQLIEAFNEDRVMVKPSHLTVVNTDTTTDEFMK
jgi:hypothetical protein